MILVAAGCTAFSSNYNMTNCACVEDGGTVSRYKKEAVFFIFYFWSLIFVVWFFYFWFLIVDFIFWFLFFVFCFLFFVFWFFLYLILIWLSYIILCWYNILISEVSASLNVAISFPTSLSRKKLEYIFTNAKDIFPKWLLMLWMWFTKEGNRIDWELGKSSVAPHVKTRSIKL